MSKRIYFVNFIRHIYHGLNFVKKWNKKKSHRFSTRRRTLGSSLFTMVELVFILVELENIFKDVVKTIIFFFWLLNLPGIRLKDFPLNYCQ